MLPSMHSMYQASKAVSEGRVSYPRPESRTFETGVYYSLYYALMMAEHAIAGVIADRTGSIGSAFVFGSLMLIVNMVALVVFRRASSKSRS